MFHGLRASTLDTKNGKIKKMKGVSAREKFSNANDFQQSEILMLILTAHSPISKKVVIAECEIARPK